MTNMGNSTEQSLKFNFLSALSSLNGIELNCWLLEQRESDLSKEEAQWLKSIMCIYSADFINADAKMKLLANCFKSKHCTERAMLVVVQLAHAVKQGEVSRSEFTLERFWALFVRKARIVRPFEIRSNKPQNTVSFAMERN